MSKPKKPLDLSKYSTSEIYSALLDHPDVIGAKIWSRTDIRTSAINYIVYNTGMDDESANDLADRITKDVMDNDVVLRDQLSDCTDAEWDAIESSVVDSFKTLAPDTGDSANP